MWAFVKSRVFQKLFKKLWRYQLESNYTLSHPLLQGIEYFNGWVLITDGVMTITKGYAWDGCSPCWKLAGLNWWVGVPDGWRTPPSNRPHAYYASLVHDAFCQFCRDIPVDKATTVTIFRELLIQGGFPKWLAQSYAAGVDLLGIQSWPGRARPALGA